MSNNPTFKIYYCYAPKDEEFLKKIKTQLNTLRQYSIEHFDQPSAGEIKDEARINAIENADVVLVLVSADLLTDEERFIDILPTLRSQKKSRDLNIYWVLTSSCLYDQTEFGKQKPLLPPNKPLATLKEGELDEALSLIAEHLLRDIQEVVKQQTADIRLQLFSMDGQTYLRDESKKRRVTIDLLNDDELNRLKAYFNNPTEEQEGIYELLSEYGTRLCNGVFPDGVPYLDNPKRKVIFTVHTDSREILSQPWELMAHNYRHLILNNFIIHRQCVGSKSFEDKVFPHKLHILYILSRPRSSEEVEVHPLSPWQSLEAMLGAFAKLPMSVEITYCEPATLEALDQILQKTKIHILHFDGHGMLDTNTGKAYLAFEHSDGSLNLTEANRVGNILGRYKIPLLVLDTCSGAQIGENTMHAMAPALLNHGGRAIVAFSQTISTAPASFYWASFYSDLASGSSLYSAYSKGIHKLHTQVGHIDKMGIKTLHNWFTPQLYLQGVNFQLLKSDLPESDKKRRIGRYRDLPKRPHAGFYGRMQESHDLKRLLLLSAPVVLHGSTNSGKSTLARELAIWLERAYFKSGYVYLNLSTQEFNLDLLFEKLYEKGIGEPVEGHTWGGLSEILGDTPILVILDHANAHLISELEEVVEWIDDEKCEGSLLVITESKDVPFQYNPVSLGPLSDNEAMALLETVMRKGGLRVSQEQKHIENRRKLIRLCYNRPGYIVSQGDKLRKTDLVDVIRFLEQFPLPK